MAQQEMIIGGGCFWCVEAAFNEIKGVTSAVSGYCGGDKSDANYTAVCTKRTKHVEVVKITFDDEIIDFKSLLTLFFTVHDATQIDGQGNDIGPQYRSAIFYQNDEQQAISLQLIEEINEQKLFDKAVVTSVEPASEFFIAEDYHQHYYKNNPEQGYCMAVVAPKFQKFKKQHAALLKSK